MKTVLIVLLCSEVFYAAPTIRNADTVVYGSASSFAVVWPVGSVAGDTALMQVCGGYNITAPNGWTQLFLRNGTAWNAYIAWKVLTAADISTGSVTVTLANAFNGTSNIVTFVGPVGFMETVTAYTSSLNFVTSATVLASDIGIGFGSNRQLNVLPTFTPGTQLDSALSATFGAAVYSVVMSGSVANTVVTNMGTSANWEGALVVVTNPFPYGWTQKCPVVIDHTKVPSNQTAFPVVITEASFVTNCGTILTTGGGAQSNGGDLRVSSDSAGSATLPIEIIVWTQNANPALAKAQLGTAVSVSSTVDVTVYVWFNAGGGQVQPAAGATTGSQPVWDSNYRGVYHWDDVVTTAAVDSTVSPNNFTGYNAGTGKIGSGIVLVSASSNYDTASDSKLPNGANPFTVEVWANWTTLTNGILVAWGGAASSFAAAAYIQYNGSNQIQFGTFSNQLLVTFTPTLATWYHISMTYDGATLRGYVNAAATSPATKVVTEAIVLNALRVGAVTWAAPTNFFNGVLDEVRISNIQRSADWITTGFNNENNPGTFAVAGAPQTVGSSVPRHSAVTIQ